MRRGSKQYFAFISYSHRDKKWGDWLHKSLETYKVPKALIRTKGRDGEVPKRLFPIFRDREELPTSSDLGSNINTALEASRYLIVICSPNSAQSQWVNEEILAWKRLGKEDRILCLIVDGEPNATDKGQPDDECFPESLKFKIGEDGELSKERTEPIAADARKHTDGKSNAKLKLLAGLLGVNYDDLKQRDQRRKRYHKIFQSVVGIAFFIGLLLVSHFQNEAKIKYLDEESKKLAGEAVKAIESDKPQLAIQLALKALPAEDNERPFKREAYVALHRAYTSNRLLTTLEEQGTGIKQIIFDATDSHMVTVNNNGEITLWDINKLRSIATFTTGVNPIAWFSEDENELITYSSNGPDKVLVELWDIGTANNKSRHEITGSAFTLSGQRPGANRSLVTTHTVDFETKNYQVQVWSVRDGKQVASFEPKSGYVQAAYFLPDGDRILIIHGEGASIYTLTNKSVIHIKDLGEKVYVSAMSANGELLAFSDQDNKAVKIVKSDTGLVQLTINNQSPKSMMFSADSQTLYLTSSFGNIDALDVKTGEENRDFAGHRGPYIAKSDADEIVFGDGDNGKISIIRDKPKFGTSWSAHETGITSIALSNSGRYLATSGKDNRLRLWDTSNRINEQIQISEWGIAGSELITDRASFLLNDSSGQVFIWKDLDKNKKPLFIHEVQQGKNHQVRWLSNGSGILSIVRQNGFNAPAGSGSLRWHDVDTGELLLEVIDPVGDVNKLPVSDDGKSIIVKTYNGNDSHFMLYKHDNGGLTKTDINSVIDKHVIDKGIPINLVMSPDGQKLFVSYSSGYLRILDKSTGEVNQVLYTPGEGEYINWDNLSFSADGRYVSVKSNKGAKVWRTSDGIEQLSKESVEDVIIEPKAKQVLTKQSDRIDFWNIETTVMTLSLPVKYGQLENLYFSNNGRYAAIKSLIDDDMVMGDLHTGATQQLKCGKGGAEKVTFSSDDSLMAIINDGNICILDLQTNMIMALYRNTARQVHHISFSPDNQKLFAFSRYDGLVDTWPVYLKSSELIKMARKTFDIK